MKKAILLLAIGVSSLSLVAQENNKFRLGVQSGWNVTKSKYAGGMSDANARFHRNPFGAVAFDVIARYDFDQHWMVMSGLGVNSLGFEFGIAENYSFTEKTKRWTSLNSGFNIFEIPVMGAYKFKPNCSGWKWIVSGGFSNILVSDQQKVETISEVTDGTVSPENAYLSSQESTRAGSYITARLMIGREKTFKRGNILNVSFIYNKGFSEMARTTVNYNIDGKSYTHDFANNGTFLGLRVSYFFRPLNGDNRNKASKSKSSVTKSNDALINPPAANN